MAKPANTPEKPAPVSGPTRSPSYPFISLERTIARAREYALIERRHSARVSRAVTYWGYKPRSSGGQQTVAALVSYCLMEDVGRGELRKVQLTDLGWQIVNDARPAAPDPAIQRAALSPRIFNDLWQLWANDLPDDATLQRYLIDERGFTEKAAEAVIRLYRENLSFTRLDVPDMVSEEAATGQRFVIEPRSQNEKDDPIDAQEEIILTPDGLRVQIKFSGTPHETTYRFLRDYMKFKAEHMSPNGEK
jgi:hypothetical protein